MRVEEDGYLFHLVYESRISIEVQVVVFLLDVADYLHGLVVLVLVGTELQFGFLDVFAGVSSLLAVLNWVFLHHGLLLLRGFWNISLFLVLLLLHIESLHMLIQILLLLMRHHIDLIRLKANLLYTLSRVLHL